VKPQFLEHEKMASESRVLAGIQEQEKRGPLSPYAANLKTQLQGKLAEPMIKSAQARQEETKARVGEQTERPQIAGEFQKTEKTQAEIEHSKASTAKLLEETKVLQERVATSKDKVEIENLYSQIASREHAMFSTSLVNAMASATKEPLLTADGQADINAIASRGYLSDPSFRRALRGEIAALKGTKVAQRLQAFLDNWGAESELAPTVSIEKPAKGAPGKSMAQIRKKFGLPAEGVK
jgi:hypothetical protein